MGPRNKSEVENCPKLQKSHIETKRKNRNPSPPPVCSRAHSPTNPSSIFLWEVCILFMKLQVYISGILPCANKAFPAHQLLPVVYTRLGKPLSTPQGLCSPCYLRIRRAAVSQNALQESCFVEQPLEELFHFPRWTEIQGTHLARSFHTSLARIRI